VIAAGLALAVGALIGSYDLLFSLHRIKVEAQRGAAFLDLKHHGAGALQGDLARWNVAKL
jgi:hypothetical protein